MLTNKFNLKYMAAIVACLVASIVFSGCEKSKSSDKQITAFVFTQPPVAGEIREYSKTIHLEVPAGTDVSSLVPKVLYSSKAKLNPKTGISTDFTLPVTYTVTAEDASTAQYKVTVTVADITGKWIRESDQLVIEIDGNEGTFYQTWSGTWHTLLLEGKINFGDVKFKDITKVEKLTWQCQDLLYNPNTETFSWSDVCNLVLDEAGTVLTLTGTMQGHQFSLKKM